MDPTILRYILLVRMRDRGHAEGVSRALQRLETMTGNGGDFRMQGVFDMAQQEYDGEAAKQHRNFRSGDLDGLQDHFYGDPNLAQAHRAAAHSPIDGVNAQQQRQYVQQKLQQAGVLYNWLNLSR
jgi:hypothetical protein